MNNHGIICKNNNMIIFLIIVIITILILINKKVEFCIDFSTVGFEYNFCININYFFDILTIYKEDLMKYKNNFSKQNKFLTGIKKYKWIAEYINVERVNMDIKIGLGDVFVTSMTIPFVSSVLAIGLQKYLPQSTKNFLVKPVYNELFFSLKGAVYINIKLKDMLYIIFKLYFIFLNKKIKKI